MGLSALFFGHGMDEGVREFRETPGAVLVDVRTPAEYAEGHVEGSVNLPLDSLSGIAERIPDRDTPLFLHCASDARSGRAAAFLSQMGYTKVKNIGGILRYRGRKVK